MCYFPVRVAHHMLLQILDKCNRFLTARIFTVMKNVWRTVYASFGKTSGDKMRYKCCRMKLVDFVVLTFFRMWYNEFFMLTV